MGKLFVCPTPIGNLEDITLRALRILKEVDLIAAEDTRKTRKLLTHYGIKTRLISYHEHNAPARRRDIIARLHANASVALVSEAGTPGLSDPGYPLIRACLDESIDVEVLPGPTAAVTALVGSGLPTDSFMYEGFVPRKQGDRRRLLEKLKDERRTLIFYESPRRIEQLLADVVAILGDRPAAVARELTKKFEETARGSASDLLEEWLPKAQLRGELVLVVGGAGRAKMEAEFTPEALRKRVVQKINGGLSKKAAIDEVAREEKLARRTVYETVKDIRGRPRSRSNG